MYSTSHRFKCYLDFEKLYYKKLYSSKMYLWQVYIYISVQPVVKAFNKTKELVIINQ